MICNQRFYFIFVFRNLNYQYMRTKNIFYLLLISITFLFSNCVNTKVNNTQNNVISVNNNVKVDSISLEIIKPYKAKMEKQMNDVIGVTEFALTKNSPEGLLGNFGADLVLKTANDKHKFENGRKVDFCILNNGGFRVDLPQGNITTGKIFELMPFDNKIVIIELKGSEVKTLCEFIVSKNGIPMSGVKIGVKQGKLNSIFIDNQLFDENKTYYVATSDYLASGGDNLTFWAKSPVIPLEIKIRDAILNYVKSETAKGNKIKSSIDGRYYTE